MIDLPTIEHPPRCFCSKSLLNLYESEQFIPMNSGYVTFLQIWIMNLHISFHKLIFIKSLLLMMTFVNGFFLIMERILGSYTTVNCVHPGCRAHEHAPFPSQNSTNVFLPSHYTLLLVFGFQIKLTVDLLIPKVIIFKEFVKKLLRLLHEDY